MSLAKSHIGPNIHFGTGCEIFVEIETAIVAIGVMQDFSYDEISGYGSGIDIICPPVV